MKTTNEQKKIEALERMRTLKVWLPYANKHLKQIQNAT